MSDVRFRILSPAKDKDEDEDKQNEEQQRRGMKMLLLHRISGSIIVQDAPGAENIMIDSEPEPKVSWSQVWPHPES
jgi:hypothetical protein